MLIKFRLKNRLSLLVLWLVLFCWFGPAFRLPDNGGAALAAPPGQEAPDDPSLATAAVTRRVNAPFFSGAFRAYEAAIFWFGRVNSSENYADVRVGYTNDALIVRVSVMDRLIWHSDSPTPAELTNYDTISLYLSKNGNTGSSLDNQDYRFVAMESASDSKPDAKSAYTGANTTWIATNTAFTAISGWRGNARNDAVDDRGWTQDFTIRFTDLGLAGPPAAGAVWGLALQLHDRDSASGAANPVKTWPEALNSTQPSTWGQLVFGLPAYTPPPAAPAGTATIRQGLNGAQVTDAAVGGTIGRLCSGDSNYIWNLWGNANFSGDERFNLQNQGDIADWPCFSKYYVTFPLSAVPAGSAILSATLTFHQFGGSDPTRAQRSLIQVFTVAEDWNESTLSWNNAPLALENVSRSWADVVDRCSWPCEPREFDVSGAVAQAVATGSPLRLALYEADTAYHSGKYFIGSEEPDWNAAARPTLTIVWGNRNGALTHSAWPLTPKTGDSVNYRLTFTGSGEALSLTAVLPSGVSAPAGLAASMGDIQYTPATRTINWTGSPASGQQVAITYQVDVQTGSTQELVSTASLQGGQVNSTARATVIANGFSIMLPYTKK